MKKTTKQKKCLFLNEFKFERDNRKNRRNHEIAQAETMKQFIILIDL